MEQGGRLAPQAESLLRLWAQAKAGDEPGGGALSTSAAIHLRSSMRLITTTLQRWRAYRVHQAAEWLVATSRRPGGTFDGPPGAARSRAPRDALPLRAPELADLDPVGLVASAEAWA